MVTGAADGLDFIILLLYPFYSTTFDDFSFFVVHMLLDVKTVEQ